MGFTVIFFLLVLCFWNTRSEIIRLNTQSIEKNCNSETATINAKQVILNTLNNRYCAALLNNTVRPTAVSTCYGYCSGSEWDDVIDTCERIVGISVIEIYYDYRQINSIQVSYLLAGGSEVTAARHGDSATGSRVLIRLGDKERIEGVEGSNRNNSISHLTFTTENERGNKTVHGPYGQTGQERFAVNGYILGLKGFSDNSVNGIGVYYLPPLIRSNHTLGGTCSNSFHDDKVDSIIPPVVGISMIKINHGALLDAIQFTYRLLDGSNHTGSLIGGPGGRQTLLKLFSDEKIYSLEVTASDEVVGILSIFTRLNGSTRGNGPYGEWYSGSSVQVSGNILGLYGYSKAALSSGNSVVCRIGIYTVD